MALMADDLDVANLRLSVFSDFSPDMRRAFCAKSCQVLSTRRNRGAMCIVATVPRYGSIMLPRPDIILGTVECSFHEFEGTVLGRRRRMDSILYITEVAVSPTARRKGIGHKLMEVSAKEWELEFSWEKNMLVVHLTDTLHSILTFSVYRRACEDPGGGNFISTCRHDELCSLVALSAGRIFLGPARRTNVRGIYSFLKPTRWCDSRS